jgi:hypothetical protein
MGKPGGDSAKDNQWLYVILAIVFSLLMISLSNLAVAKADDLSTHEGLDQSTIQTCMACLWKHTGNGQVKVEAAAWVLKESNGYKCYYWPQKIRNFGDPLPPHTVAAITWNGVIPKNKIALIHTHPLTSDRMPSPTDEDVATRLKVPNYVVSEFGVSGAVPYEEVNRKGKVKNKISRETLYTGEDLEAWSATLNNENCPEKMPQSMLWNPWITEINNK